MRETLYAGVLTRVLFSCASPRNLYQKNLLDGKKLYDQKEYGKARDAFVAASRLDNDPLASTWAAMADYKLNDLAGPEGQQFSTNATGRLDDRQTGLGE